MPNPTCAFPDCGKQCVTPVIIYCTGHYAQQQRGKPLTPILRTDAERFWAKVDKTGPCWIWLGATRGRGYGCVQYKGKVRTAHRVAWELTRGTLSADLYLDHICHNISCVRPDHLQPCTQSGNMENRRGASSTSSTGVRGVYKHGNGYQASVKTKGKRHHGGTFKTIEEAEKAAIALRNKLMRYNYADRT